MVRLPIREVCEKRRTEIFPRRYRPSIEISPAPHWQIAVITVSNTPDVNSEPILESSAVFFHTVRKFQVATWESAGTYCPFWNRLYLGPHCRRASSKLVKNVHNECFTSFLIFAVSVSANSAYSGTGPMGKTSKCRCHTFLDAFRTTSGWCKRT